MLQKADMMVSQLCNNILQLRGIFLVNLVFFRAPNPKNLHVPPSRTGFFANVKSFHLIKHNSNEKKSLFLNTDFSLKRETVRLIKLETCEKS